MRYQLAIFDFDGTLADSGEWFISNLPEISERFRLRHVTRDEIEMLRGKSSREVIAWFGVPAWKLPAISTHVRKLAGEQADRIRLFEGVGDTLRALDRAGVRIAIVTSNAEENVRRILGAENASRISWFECGASLFGKAPKFRRALKRSGVPTRAALSIGDETRDIEAARQVGISSGAVLWGYAHRAALEAMGPDALFASPAEIPPFVLG